MDQMPYISQKKDLFVNQFNERSQNKTRNDKKKEKELFLEAFELMKV